MVNLKLSRMEVQELRVWAYYNREIQEEIGLKWCEDQKKLVEKLNLAVGKDKEGNPLKAICVCGKPIEQGLGYKWWHNTEDGNLISRLGDCNKAIPIEVSKCQI